MSQRGKTINVLRKLSHSELKHFERFLRSPFFNSNKNLIRFYSYLKKFSPDFNFDHEKAHKFLFPDKKINPVKIRQLLSDLLLKLLDYLSYEGYIKNRLLKNTILMKELLQKEEFILLADTFKNSKSHQKKMNVFDSDYYYDNYILETVYIDFLSSKSGLYHETLEHMKEQQGQFNKYVVHTLLKLNLDRLIYRHYSDDLQLILFDELLSHLRTNDYDDVPIKTYYKLLLMELNPKDGKFYYDYKKIVLKNWKYFDRIEAANLFKALTNYCTIKISKRKNKYISEVFDLYQIILKNNLYEIYEGKYLHHIDFLKILLYGLNLNKKIWTFNFIQNYKEKLSGKHKDNAYYLGMSFFCFSERYFEKTLEYLTRVKTIDLVYKVFLKNLLIKTYYELGETELIKNQIDSFRHFLRKNKKLIEKMLCEKQLVFIKWVSKLLSLKRTGGFLSSLEHKSLFSSNPDNWLIEKANVFKKGIKPFK